MTGSNLSAEYARARLEDGYYEDLTASIRALGKTCLAEVTYNVDFKRIIDTYTGNHSFVTKNGGVFTINIFGQIAPTSAGTIISAKGNHYMGRDGEKASPTSPKQIFDGSTAKDILVVGAPTDCDEILSTLFLNQIATLNEVKEAEELEELESDKDFKSKESGGGQRVKKRKLDEVNNSDDDSTASSTVEAVLGTNGGEILSDVLERNLLSVSEPVVKMGAFYDPRLNDDYRGDLFKLVDDKLVQLDVRTAKNELIAPWKFYDALKPGTLILAECTLHIFLMEDTKKGFTRKTYQINARSIRVLDGSDADPIPREVPEFNREPSTSNTKRQEKSDVTNAFASFEVPVKRKKTVETPTTRNNASPVGNASTKKPGGQKKNKKKNPIVEEEEGDVDMEGCLA
ncbi:hypothetical protein H0H93_007574 [Arthromyces matolae]|nr:hypothetical protein H0H93_007574 [Arthromyces matolae]